MTAVRQPVLAGTWYPADPDHLRSEVASFLDAADPTRAPAGTPVIALAPHAGYAYSGAVAGKLFGLLRERRYAAVFVLAPSHRSRLDRPALSGADAFATPLGEVPVATDIVAELAASGAFTLNDRAHAFEHAVEIQLPLLQCALPAGTPIVPILVPHLSSRRRLGAARVLDRWRDGRHLFLVSSDLTHYGVEYGYVPFTEEIPRRLEELDSGALLKFLGHDSPGLVAYGEQTGITMCGLEAAALVLATPAAEGYQAELLEYARSADREGDYSLSVSYAAAVICDPPGPDDARPTRESRSASEPSASESTATGGQLTDAERFFLLDLARRAVTAAVCDEAPPDPADLAARAGIDLTGPLGQPRGAFVTLNARGQLRGCIGYIEGIKPLIEAVVDNGAAAAVSDPRFPVVREDELPGLEIEISALTPLCEVAGPEDIEVGRHGILLSKGTRRAVFLPQVATEQGWDLATTLDHLAVKAGLPADAWRENCRFEVFEAEICGE
jgi:AmmeMemoRadiSam system protein B/AmmeMemoRadiSam system protein A